MTSTLRVAVSEDGADPERLDTMARHLREELVAVPETEVVAALGGTAPAGTRGLDIVAAGGLVVSILSSDYLWTIVSGIRSWLRRGEPRGAPSASSWMATSSSSSRRRRPSRTGSIELFVARHGAQ